MQRKNLSEMPCPVARTLERVGEWWTILILRDASHGLTRFEQFQKSLGIAPNMLTRRLNALETDGFLARRRYSERPPRDEYVLTAQGRDFYPVMIALFAYGNRHYAHEGIMSQVVDEATGRAEPAGRVVTVRPPGSDCGRVMRRNTVNGCAPRSAAASTRVTSCFSRFAYSGRIMNGR